MTKSTRMRSKATFTIAEDAVDSAASSVVNLIKSPLGPSHARILSPRRDISLTQSPASRLNCLKGRKAPAKDSEVGVNKPSIPKTVQSTNIGLTSPLPTRAPVPIEPTRITGTQQSTTPANTPPPPPKIAAVPIELLQHGVSKTPKTLERKFDDDLGASDTEDTVMGTPDGGYQDEEMMDAPDYGDFNEADLDEMDMPTPTIAKLQKKQVEIRSPEKVQNVTEEIRDTEMADVDQESPASDNSPVHALVRKSSLSFATLPARDPLASKKSLGLQGPRKSQTVSKTEVSTTLSGLVRMINGGKASSLGRQLTQAEKQDIHLILKGSDPKKFYTIAEREELEDAIHSGDLQLLFKLIGDAEDTSLHRKISTQRLQDRITMLGQNNAAKPSKSLGASGSSQNASASQQDRAIGSEDVDNQAVSSSMANKVLGSQPSVPTSGTLGPLHPETYTSHPRKRSSLLEVQIEIQAEKTIPTSQISIADSGYHSQSTIPSLSSQIQSVAQPRPTGILNANDSYGSSKPLTSTRAPVIPDFPVPLAAKPMASPKSKNHTINNSKARLQAVMKSAKGLFASSANVSAQARTEALQDIEKPRRSSTRQKEREERERQQKEAEHKQQAVQWDEPAAVQQEQQPPSPSKLRRVGKLNKEPTTKLRPAPVSIKIGTASQQQRLGVRIEEASEAEVTHAEPRQMEQPVQSAEEKRLAQKAMIEKRREEVLRRAQANQQQQQQDRLERQQAKSTRPAAPRLVSHTVSNPKVPSYDRLLTLAQSSSSLREKFVDQSTHPKKATTGSRLVSKTATAAPVCSHDDSCPQNIELTALSAQTRALPASNSKSSLKSFATSTVKGIKRALDPESDTRPPSRQAAAVPTHRYEPNGFKRRNTSEKPPSQVVAPHPRPALNRPADTVASDKLKRALEAEKQRYRPEQHNNAATSQASNPSKRLRLSPEGGDEQPRGRLMAPPMRPSNIRKPDLPASSAFVNGYVKAPIPNAYNHSQASSMTSNPLKNSQIRQPFTEASSNVSRAHLPSKAAAPPKAQWVDTGNIELPECVTSDEDNSDAEYEDYVPKPKPTVPEWANPENLMKQLHAQQDWDTDAIFGPVGQCDLEEIFPNKKERFSKWRARGSSANWGPSVGMLPAAGQPIGTSSSRNGDMLLSSAEKPGSMVRCGDGLTHAEVVRDREARMKLKEDGKWTMGLGETPGKGGNAIL